MTDNQPKLLIEIMYPEGKVSIPVTAEIGNEVIQTFMKETPFTFIDALGLANYINPAKVLFATIIKIQDEEDSDD